jgi:hypothetical protein
MDLRSKIYLLIYYCADMLRSGWDIFDLSKRSIMKFNLGVKEKDMVVNYEGAKAYTLSPEMELYAAVATTMLSDAHYETGDQRLERIKTLLTKVSPVFVAQLAIYARTRLNLRSVPVVLVTELAKIQRGNDLVCKTIQKVVQRPDEIMEVLAYYQVANQRSGTKKLHRVSKQVQKGLAAAFNKFDEYQFAKYDRAAEVRLRDALFLVHPKAKDEKQQGIFDKIAQKTLETPYTWETQLSALGSMVFDSEAEQKAAVTAKWEELIDSGKIGYMALLRNVRNILEAHVSSAHVKKVGESLSDPEAVKKSKQLPFRFLAAYRELKTVQSGYTAYLMDMLDSAINVSAEGLEGFGLDTRVVIACDVSGSMQKAVSAKSKVMLYDIGLLLGMLLHSRCKHVLTGMFGETWKTVPLPNRGVLANVDAFYKREGEVGYATNGYLVVKDLVEKKYVADKVMLFTDTQMWDTTTGNQSKENTLRYQWLLYKRIAPEARLYVFDLAGYGKVPLQQNQDDVYLIAGWSDKIFSVLQALENGERALEMIDKIEL